MTSSCGKTIGASNLEQRSELLKRATSVWRNQRGIAWDLARPPSRDTEGGALLSIVQQTAVQASPDRRVRRITPEPSANNSGMKKLLSGEA